MSTNCFHAGKRPNSSGAKANYDMGKRPNVTGAKVTRSAGLSSGLKRDGAPEGAPAMGKGKK